MEQRAGLLRRERLGWREKSGGRDWRRLKEGDGSVWSGRCVWSSSLLPVISESSAVLSIHSGYPFLCATAPPLLPNTHTHTHTSETTVLICHVIRGGASSLNFRVSILPWNKRSAMSSIPVVFLSATRRVLHSLFLSLSQISVLAWCKQWEKTGGQIWKRNELRTPTSLLTPVRTPSAFQSE